MRFPLASAPQLRAFGGRAATSTDQERLVLLADRGLVAALDYPRGPGRALRLWHLTALGHGVAPAPLARLAGLRGADLARALRRLPERWATYELLAAVADLLRVTGPTRAPGPDLLRWALRWHGTVQRAHVEYREEFWVPAVAWYGWAGGAVEGVMLVPDLGHVGPRAWSRLLARALAWCDQCRAADQVAPTILVATAAGQQFRDWVATRVQLGATAEALVLTTWDALAAGDLELPAPPVGAGTPAAAWEGARHPLDRAPAPPPAAPRRRLVTAGLADLPGVAASPDRRLTPLDRLLLETLGAHPFLPPSRLAGACGATAAAVRASLARLIARGLVRLADDVPLKQVRAAAAELAALPGAAVGTAAGELALHELTADGIAAVLDWAGLPADLGGRWLGLVGNGPLRPIGPRRNLLHNLAHTLGADALVVALATALATGRDGRPAARRAALTRWRGAAGSVRGLLRPDASGRVERVVGGEARAFLLEFDRAHEREGPLLAKWRQYYRFYGDGIAAGRYHIDYPADPPWLLVVTTDPAMEAVLARTICDARAPGEPPLAALLTTTTRIGAAGGPLGRIWRRPDAAEPVPRHFWFTVD